jgi:hypothetical protein
MVNTELQCMQLFIQYTCLVTTLVLYNLPRTTVYFCAVRCVMRIVESCSDVFNHGVRMHSITVVLGSYEFELRI